MSMARRVIWAGVLVLVLAAVAVVALGVTSTRWFCAVTCHQVQDDTIAAYDRSSHSEISCMACHEPVGGSALVLVFRKLETVGELYQTATNTFKLPLNGDSEVALTMDSAQCTQCHDLAKRPVTPSSGVIINHKVHAQKGVTCTICHNRIAHDENFDLKLKDPGTGKLNSKHEQFMSMTACFRCHTLGKDSEGLKAPGKCSTCHPSKFRLKPASHLTDDFYPAGHAKLAQQEQKRVAQQTAKAGAGQENASGDEGVGEKLVKVASINACSTCHAETFCTDCHGIPMPHPSGFKKRHGELGKKNPKVCARCHGGAKQFCDGCHHGTSLGWDIDAGVDWRIQHPAAVKNLGANACFDCHTPTYCSHCHVRGSTD